VSERNFETDWPPPPSGVVVARARNRVEATLRERPEARVSGSVGNRSERFDDHLKSYADCLRTEGDSPLRVWTEPIEGRVLEVGCGFGQVLLALSRGRSPAQMTGVDLDRELLRFGTLLCESAPAAVSVPRFLVADALHLPFANRSFDLVICRVVLMSLPVRAALKELARVVADDGRLYLHLTEARFYVRDFWRGRWKGSLLAMLNGSLLAILSAQICLRGLWNNFQTVRWVRKVLREEGLSVIGVERNKVLAKRGEVRGSLPHGRQPLNL